MQHKDTSTHLIQQQSDLFTFELNDWTMGILFRDTFKILNKIALGHWNALQRRIATLAHNWSGKIKTGKVKKMNNS